MASRPRMPRCKHCQRAMVLCLARPPHRCPPQGHGYVHHSSGKHRCGPQAGSTYAEVARDG